MPGGSFNPIETFFVRLSNTVPKEILDVVFNPKRDNRINVDNVIREQVLGTWVLPDINLRGARTKDIMLREEMAVMPELNDNDKRRSSGRYSIYRIPKELLEGGDITSVTSINYPSVFDNATGDATGILSLSRLGGTNTMAGAGGRVIEMISGATESVSQIAEVVGTNIIQLIPATQSHLNYVLTFKINYDKDLNNLGEAAYQSFVDLAVCAVKAHIYNKLILSLDKGRIEGGFEIGAFAEKVRSWENQEAEYNEKLRKFSRSSIIADKREFNRLLYYIV